MQDDQVIARIREARHRISEECGHDPWKLAEHYRNLEMKHKDRLFRPEEAGEEVAEDLLKP